MPVNACPLDGWRGSSRFSSAAAATRYRQGIPARSAPGEGGCAARLAGTVVNSFPLARTRGVFQLAVAEERAHG